jgi:hypothetical protein
MPRQKAHGSPYRRILRANLKAEATTLSKLMSVSCCLESCHRHPASNQVNALWKPVTGLTNGDENAPVKQRLEVAQTQIFVRLTIG